MGALLSWLFGDDEMETVTYSTGEIVAPSERKPHPMNTRTEQVLLEGFGEDEDIFAEPTERKSIRDIAEALFDRPEPKPRISNSLSESDIWEDVDVPPAPNTPNLSLIHI